jgi:mannosylglycerate hydrolase
MMEESNDLDIVIVTHTHWDREWYWPFERFRFELVRLLDRVLLVLETTPEFRSFFLDGQAAALEDYLEVRPEHEPRIRSLVAQGRLGVGPWYTLPDEFLASGESLIRNLLLGHRIAGRFGPVARVGYCPDTFGHPQQLPQLLRGFGIENFFFMRGLERDVQELRSEFLWEAPDGSEVLAHFLSESYTNAAILRPRPEETALHHGRIVNYDSLYELRDRLSRRASTGTILLMNGGDHLEIQDDLPVIIQNLRTCLGDRIIHGTLTEFVDLVRSKRPDLRRYRGDLLGGRYFTINLGCLSSRMYLKQRNAQVQTALERVTEPLAALAEALGAPPFRAYLRQAWRYLLQNQAHDSICGCSVDAVHEDMMGRFKRAEEVAEAVQRTALEYLAGQLELAQASDEIRVLIFNPSPWPRTDLTEVVLVPFVGFPFGIRTFTPSGYQELDLSRCAIADPTGKDVSFELVGEGHLVDDPRYRRKIVPTATIRFLARDLPTLGYRVYTIRPKETLDLPLQPRAPRRPQVIENEFLRVTPSSDGTLLIEDRNGRAVYRGMHFFEDSGDAGDEYAYAVPKRQRVIDSRHTRADVVFRQGVDVGEIWIDLVLRLPEGLTSDGGGRSRRRVPCHVSSVVRLLPGVRRIDVNTTVENLARDHRLRVVFPTGIRAGGSVSDDGFAAVTRSLTLPDGDDWEEQPSPTRPHRYFVAVEDGRRGLAVASVGLTEHEVAVDGTINLTLLRSVGLLSRGPLPNRKGSVGPPLATPGAQCLGIHRFRYGIIPYRGTWQAARIWRSAEDVGSPLVGWQVREARGTLPSVLPFIRVDPAEIVVTAVKPPEEDEGMIVRLYNISGEPVSAEVEMLAPISRASEVNLNEEHLRGLDLTSERRLRMDFGPFQIKTLRVILKQNQTIPSAQQ